MSWGRLDDQANGNAKLLALSDAAWRMWGCGLIYCQANLTDGFIPEHAIHTFGVRAKNKALVVDELCSVLVYCKGPLWERVQGGYQVHDYFDWNDSREDIIAGRQKTKQRLERWRERRRNGVGNALRDAPETPSEQVSTSTPTTTLRKERGDRERIRGLFLEKFWPAWPRGHRVGKEAAEKAFLKLAPNSELFVEILDALERHKQSRQWQNENGRFIPHASSWINGKRWEDEIAAVHRPGQNLRGPDWRSECDELHGGRCGNMNFHVAKMAEQSEVPA